MMPNTKKDQRGAVLRTVLTLAAMSAAAGLHAQSKSSKPGITLGEIALYVGLIIALVGIAWLWAFKGKQAESHPPQHSGGHSHHAHGHQHTHHHGHGKHHGKHHRR